MSKSGLSFTNEYYDQSHEWELMSYSYGILDKKNKATGYHFPTLVVSLEVRRMTPFYSVTVILPVIFVVVIANLGLIIPGKMNK